MVVPDATNPLSGAIAIRCPTADASSARDTVRLVVGCLLAYQIGRGSEATPVSEEPEANREAPADPGDAGGESGSGGDDGP